MLWSFGIYSWLKIQWGRLPPMDFKKSCETSQAETGTSICLRLPWLKNVSSATVAWRRSPWTHVEHFLASVWFTRRQEDAVRARSALLCSLPLLRPFASGCFAFPLLPLFSILSQQQWGCSSASQQLPVLLVFSSHWRPWAGQPVREAGRTQLGLLMHSWICSSGRCKHQGLASNSSGYKTAGDIQMTTLNSAPHCRGWQNVSG